jgi:hypothetical protein
VSIFSSGVLGNKRPTRQQATALLSFVVATAVGFVPGPRLDDGSPPAPQSSVTRPSPSATGPSPVAGPSPAATPDPTPSASAPPPAPTTQAKPSAPPGGSTSLLGNDVSWPQCNTALPEIPAFAIVGVNNGLANTTNPCLHQQLEWAETALGGTAQPAVALYVNTANPGHAGSWWPNSNDYGGKSVTNPHGTCTGAEDAACAYMYGYAKAFDDAYLRTVPDPEEYLWWLDVETENTWSGDRNANRAVLEGMTDFFHSIGADVGIYSASLQWWQIVGTVSEGSSLYSLPSWLAGAHTAEGAKINCSLPPLTSGGQVTLTQFVSNGFDYNYSCI